MRFIFWVGELWPYFCVAVSAAGLAYIAFNAAR
jgi:hypothetical protein